MRFVVFTIVLLIATSVWSWPFSNRSVDMNISVLAEVESDVPAEYVDMEPQQRKYEFVEWILPIVERQNDQILQLRKIVLQIQRKEMFKIAITEDEQNFLNMLQLEYGGNSIQDLLERINIIPISMIIAQASLESGWGSSRFAVEGNNLFGIRTWTESTPHLLIKGIDKWPGWGVKVFASKCDSVKEYVRLLNEHPAYEDFRKARTNFHVKNLEPDPLILIQNIDKFSTTADYDKRVKRIIVKVRKLEEKYASDKTINGDNK